MKLGVYQCRAGATQDEKLAGLEKHMAGQHCNLVLCPELFATGYDQKADYGKLAEAPTGPFAKRMAGLAILHGTALAWGYAEKGQDSVYNSAALIGAEGQLIANHRKRLASPQSFEVEAFGLGEAVTFAEVGGVRVAMIICYEVEFPESLRQAAQGGAQLVLVPTALGRDWGIVAEKVVPTRAFENGIYIGYADHAGELHGLGFYGGGRIVAPDGEVSAVPVGEEGFVTIDIDLDRVAAAQARLPYLADCRKL
ncbi:MAG: nitrilase-related carbon-nitrogen hydrolase [Roseovarius sp.]|uniref:nitrilase-related carbon-nitrogen hydrolase n=1 Tax=Roseovarius sp. TaxID=1486281 RepID=UPI0032ED63F5